MVKKVFYLCLLCFSILVTAYCAQINNSRNVSSGEFLADSDKVISIATDLGRWHFTIDTPGEPVGISFINAYYQCNGSSEILKFSSQSVRALERQTSFSEKYTWGEIKTLAPKSYQRNEAHLKPQSEASVVVMRFVPIQSVVIETGKASKDKSNSPKKVLWDLAHPDACGE